MSEHEARIAGFLAAAGWAGATPEPLAGDASARRYVRLRRASGETAVLMDDPPGPGQKTGAFLAVGAYLRGLGLSPPDILAADQAAGLVLLEDLGDALYARIAAPGLEQCLYEAAVDVLVVLDGAVRPEFAPEFDIVTMCEQTAPAYEWYRGLLPDARGERHIGAFRAELETVFRRTLPERRTILLRDYHAENLIWLPKRNGIRRVGLLDFQDAMTGPPGYDLVSLLLDARRDVPGPLVDAMIARFARGTGTDEAALRAAFAAMGVQRNLRILGVFARLARRDGKRRYLAFIPRVWAHVTACLAHPDLADLAAIVAGDFPAPDIGAITAEASA